MLHRLRFIAVGFAVLAFFFPYVFAKRALGADVGDVLVHIRDGSSGKPIRYASVFLIGAVRTTRGLSDGNGDVTFLDITTAEYTVRAYADDYDEAEERISVVANQRAEMTLQLYRPGTMKHIASVSVRYRPSLSATDAKSESPVAAFGLVPSAALNQFPQTQGFASGQIGLYGHQPSQTMLTLNGLPVAPPGNRQPSAFLGSDLFSSLSLGYGSYGALGGTVAAEFPDPTLNWQSQGTLEYGTYGSNGYSVSERGTTGFVGISVGHAVNTTIGALNGEDFSDLSGLRYGHSDFSTIIGNGAKVTVPLAGQIFGFTLTSLSTGAQTTCQLQVATAPCSYGAGSSASNIYNAYSVSDRFKIGKMRFWFNGGTLNGQESFLTGAAARGYSVQGVPYEDNWRAAFSSVTVEPYADAKQSIVASYSAYTWGQAAPQGFDPTSPLNSYYWSREWLLYQYNFPGTTKVSAAVINSAIDRQSMGGARLLVSTAVHGDDYSASYNSDPVGGSGQYLYIDDPTRLNYLCSTHETFGYGPSSEQTLGSNSYVGINWHRKRRHYEIFAQLFDQVEHGAPLSAEVSGEDLPSTLLSPSYLETVNDFARSPGACGSSAGKLTARDMFFEVNATVPMIHYDEAYSVARIDVGNQAFLQPYLGLVSAVATGLASYVGVRGSPIGAGAPLPATPYSTYGLLADSSLGSHSELIASWRHVSKNNYISPLPYDIFDAAISIKLKGGGALTAFADNISNTHAFLFANVAGRTPLIGSGSAPTFGYPLQGRSVGLRFDLRARASLAQQGTETDSNLTLQPAELPTKPPSDPYRLLRDSPQCRPEDVAKATAQIKAIAAYWRDATALASQGKGFLADREVAGLLMSYRQTATDMAVGVSVKDGSSALYRCADLHAGPLDSLRTLGVYVPLRREVTTDGDLVWFDHKVGFYIVTDEVPDTIGAVSFSPLPSSPPTQPFAVKVDASCPSYMRGAASDLLHKLAAIVNVWRDGHGPLNVVPPWNVTVKSGASGRSLQLSLPGQELLFAVEQCGVVHAASLRQLKALGISSGPSGSLNYTMRYGLYVVSPAGTR